MFSSGCYKLRDKLNTLCPGYKNSMQAHVHMLVLNVVYLNEAFSFLCCAYITSIPQKIGKLLITCSR